MTAITSTTIAKTTTLFTVGQKAKTTLQALAYKVSSAVKNAFQRIVDFLSRIFSRKNPVPVLAPVPIPPAPAQNPVENRPAPTLVEDRPAPTLVEDRPAPTLVEDRPAPTLVEDRPAPTLVEEQDSPICGICLESLNKAKDEETDEILTTISTKCAHVFHKNCLNLALKEKDECPLCRKPAPLIFD